MRGTLGALVVLLVLGVGVLAGAEWLVKKQIEAVVADLVTDQLTGPGDTAFASVDSTVEGLALRALVDGRFDAVRVDARDGVVRGVPVSSVEVLADGVTTDGRQVEALQATVRADAGAMVAVGLDPAVAVPLVAGATAVPTDQVRVGVPYEVPGLGLVQVEADLLFRAADGGLVVEPVAARAGETPLDLATTPVPLGYGVGVDQLPAGLQVRRAVVDDVDGRPVLSVDLACPSGCSLR